MLGGRGRAGSNCMCVCVCVYIYIYIYIYIYMYTCTCIYAWDEMSDHLNFSTMYVCMHGCGRAVAQKP